MFATVSTFPAAVLKSILNPVVIVVSTCIMTDPASSIDMRVVGMSVTILEIPTLVILMCVAMIFARSLDGSCSRIFAIDAIAMVVMFRK